MLLSFATMKSSESRHNDSPSQASTSKIPNHPCSTNQPWSHRLGCWSMIVLLCGTLVILASFSCLVLLWQGSLAAMQHKSPPSFFKTVVFNGWKHELSPFALLLFEAALVFMSDWLRQQLRPSCSKPPACHFATQVSCQFREVQIQVPPVFYLSLCGTLLEASPVSCIAVSPLYPFLLLWGPHSLLPFFCLTLKQTIFRVSPGQKTFRSTYHSTRLRMSMEHRIGCLPRLRLGDLLRLRSENQSHLKETPAICIVP